MATNTRKNVRKGDMGRSDYHFNPAASFVPLGVEGSLRQASQQNGHVGGDYNELEAAGLHDSGANATAVPPRRSSRSKRSDISFSKLLADDDMEMNGYSSQGEDGVDSWDDASGSGSGGRRRRSASHVPVNYRGVTMAGDKVLPWKATINHRGFAHEIGCFTTEVEAARAYDEMARRLHGEKARLNFPKDGERSRMGKSLYRGISWQAKCNKFEARLKFGGKMRYIGVFTDEKEAAEAWDMEALRMRGERVKRLNFPEKENEYIARLQAAGDWPGSGNAVVKRKAEPAPVVVSGSKRREKPPTYDEDSSDDDGGDSRQYQRRGKRARGNPQQQQQQLPPQPMITEPPVHPKPVRSSRRGSVARVSLNPSMGASEFDDRTLSLLSQVADQYPRLAQEPLESNYARAEDEMPRSETLSLDDKLRTQLVDILSRNASSNSMATAEAEEKQAYMSSPYFGAAAMGMQAPNALTIETDVMDLKQSAHNTETIFTMTHGREMLSPVDRNAGARSSWYSNPTNATSGDRSVTNTTTTPSNSLPPMMDMESIKQAPSYVMGFAFQDGGNSMRNGMMTTSPMAFMASFTIMRPSHANTSPTMLATSAAATAALSKPASAVVVASTPLGSESCRSSAGSVPSATSKVASDDAMNAARLLTHMNDL